MGGSGGGSYNTIIEDPLPDYAQSHVESYLTRAFTLSDEAYAPYDGDVYAAQNVYETDGITAIATRATSGHVIITKAETYLQAKFGGNHVGVNAKLDDVFTADKEELLEDFKESLAGISRQLNASGNFGSGAHHVLQAIALKAFARQLGRIPIDVYGEDHFGERRNQVHGLSHGIPYGQESAKDAIFQRQAGLYQREYTQGEYEANYKDWKDQEVSKVRRLEIIGNAIRAMVGANIVTTEPFYRPSTFQEIAGLALTGLSLYSKLYKPGSPMVESSTGGGPSGKFLSYQNTGMADMGIMGEPQ